MDHTDLAYLSGLFDGEGCISIIKGKNYTHDKKVCPSPRYRLRIQLTNTNKEVMDWLASIGWYVRERKDLKKHWKRCWIGAQHDTSAVKWLKILLPYLKVKKDEAQLAMKFQEVKNQFTHNNGRRGLSDETLSKLESLKIQMSELKNQKI
jgi:hypothetical protein